MDDRDGGLSPAGDHVDVRGPEVLGQVRRWHHSGSDGGRGQVDRGDAGLPVAGRGLPVDVGRGGLEDHVWPLGLVEKPVDALVAGLEAQCAGPARPSLAGSIPIIQRGSSHSERSSL